MAETLTLDVGCGKFPKGDVNADISRTKEVKIPNFVIADTRYLPFKDRCFVTVFSSHTIEHVENPHKMLDELWRVSMSKVIVKCPYRFGSGAKRPSHINFFDKKWFKQEFDRRGVGHCERISVFDFPLTNRLSNDFNDYAIRVDKGFGWRIVRHIEFVFSHLFNIGFEVECEVTK